VRLTRGLCVLAIIVALWGAPSLVSEPDAPTRTDEMVSDVLLVGVAGVASVAILGALLLIGGRRRGPRQAAADATSSVADDETHRRLARSGRVRAVDDPIVAALGVDDEMAARRAIRRATRQSRGGARADPGPIRRPPR